MVNEPLATAVFCGHWGIWPPHGTGDQGFVQILRPIARAVVQTTQALRREVDAPCFVHIDTCEGHEAQDEASEEVARTLNQHRFLVHDLMLGRVDERHPLRAYLRAHGFSEADLDWHRSEVARFDVLGLDYYEHSEGEYRSGERVFPLTRPRGFAAVAREYAERYRVPVILAETNIYGEPSERITWLREMALQCEQLKAQGPISAATAGSPSSTPRTGNPSCDGQTAFPTARESLTSPLPLTTELPRAFLPLSAR